MKIQDFADGEKPRERLLGKGPAALSDSELLAILLRTGTRGRNVTEIAKDLLASAGGRLTSLASSTPHAMSKVKGVGPDKAATVLAALELGRRFALERGKVAVRRLDNAAAVCREIYPLLKGLDHEETWVLYLRGNNSLIAKEQLARGGPSSTTIDIREITLHCLEKKARKVILVHNHPSGDPQPGQADLRETSALCKALSSLDLVLADHVIISDNAYFSFNENAVKKI